MRRFADDHTELVFNTGFSPRLSKHISRLAHQRLHLLIAAHAIPDLRVFRRTIQWSEPPDTYSIRLEQKWFITFRWEPPIGAVEIRLERRKVG